jgi:cell division protease FtsH
MIDIEVRNLIEECYQITKQLLLSKRDKLEELSKILLEREILLQPDIEEILGKRPYEKHEEHKQTPDTPDTSEQAPTIEPVVNTENN